MPISQGGSDDVENLALACFQCNLWKSAHVTAVDPETQRESALFHPRRHTWDEHFIWSSDGRLIIPKTAIGRATVTLLKMNRRRAVEIRAADVLIGRHPPIDDPVKD